MAKDVIKEFAADGVKYLELRSTPRDGNTTGIITRLCKYIETSVGNLFKSPLNIGYLKTQ